MLKQFPPPRDYASLSVRDLLDARDAYHTHLTHLQNVVATAIGLYRFRETDYYANHAPHAKRSVATPSTNGRKRGVGPKTPFNSVVRAWSWPCVLVFVSEWLDQKVFVQSPDQMVPRALYLPDGRVIPTCVITLEDQQASAPPIEELSFPRNRIGGGCSVISEVQGKEHVASLGCLVSDGRTVYAITNKHVTGDEGTVIYTSVRGQRERIGTTAVLRRGKMAFKEAYPGWPGTDAVLNMDVGLVEVDDLNVWTPAILGLGNVGEPLDLNPDSITLDLIDCPVRAYGGASQWLFGRIDALFYRYKAMGGTEYVADFLIAPASKRPQHAPEHVQIPTQTRPGDSGTLWCLDWVDPTTKAFEPRPLGIQWGGHVFSNGSVGSQSYALATNFATVCRELDVDLVRDWAGRLPEYWGDVGHYTIAAKACEIVEASDLQTLLANNLDRISYSDDDLSPATFKGLSKAAFVPLADVPDKVWKMHGAGARGGPEHPNHFADMDAPGQNGQTLLDLTAAADDKNTDPAKATLDTFESYYTAVKDKSKGILPFRVEQLFQIMVDTNNVREFVAAAGVIAHYVGDACQPLHISYLNNGYPDGRGNGVHEAYESKMLNVHTAEILAQVNAALRIGHGGTHGLPLVQTAREARIAVIQLMRETFATISPKDICDAYIADPASLWDRFGQQTIQVIVSGVKTLAMIYDSAWQANPNENWSLAAIPESALRNYYIKPAWAPSKTINGIAAVLDSSGN